MQEPGNTDSSHPGVEQRLLQWLLSSDASAVAAVAAARPEQLAQLTAFAAQLREAAEAAEAAPVAVAPAAEVAAAAEAVQPAAAAPAVVTAAAAVAAAVATDPLRPFICAVPGCDKAYPDQKTLNTHHKLKHPELQQVGRIDLGSRVQDSEGIYGEIVAATGSWVTLRTDAGEERSVRKVDLELLAPEAEAAATAEAALAAAAPAVVTAAAKATPAAVTSAAKVAAAAEVAPAAAVAPLAVAATAAMAVAAPAPAAPAVAGLVKAVAPKPIKEGWGPLRKGVRLMVPATEFGVDEES